jgi:hypothetical protein
MNLVQEALNVLRFKPWKRLPVVYFSFWAETLEKWRAEGRFTEEEFAAQEGAGALERIRSGQLQLNYFVARKLGFDCSWGKLFNPYHGLYPRFSPDVLEQLPDGMKKVRNWVGATVLVRDGAKGIPAEVDHLLKNRADWEQHYRHRFAYSEDRFNAATVDTGRENLPFTKGGKEFLVKGGERENPVGLFGGSMVGHIRDIVGLEQFSYMQMDAEEDRLFPEMVETVSELSVRLVEQSLKLGLRFEYLHFWEDIAGKNGPLIVPRILAAYAGPYYRRVCEMARGAGIDIVSLDSDGEITPLVPIWLDCGINVLFPIEFGTWSGSIEPWRKKYGRSVRGVGGMNKQVFAYDRAAVDAEVERLKRLVDLGGFLPCPDHAIPPDAEWDNVVYYCERMRRVFGG